MTAGVPSPPRPGKGGGSAPAATGFEYCFLDIKRSVNRTCICQSRDHTQEPRSAGGASWCTWPARGAEAR